MANSTTNLDTISPSQATKEVTANAFFDAASPSALFGRRASTTAALTWGYYGGTCLVNGVLTTIANGSLVLTANLTNYVEATLAGVVSANTTGFTSGSIPLYQIVVGAATVTSYSDWRYFPSRAEIQFLTAAVAGAGPGVWFYPNQTVIKASSTNNATTIETLLKTPSGQVEVVDAMNAVSNTILAGGYLYDTALGGLAIDAGVWNFAIWASVSSTAAGRISTITQNMMQVIAGTGTVAITGTGTSRTATITGGTPFISGDASATNTAASYLYTPLGLFQITGFTSSSVVTITTLSGYVNETGVAYSNWRKLFGVTTPTITALTTAYGLYAVTSVQNAFTIAATDKLAMLNFATSNNTTTVNYVHSGTTRYSNIQSPLVVRHNDLSGLNVGDMQHLTAAQLATVSAGGLFNPPKYTTAGAPAWVAGGCYYDTTLSKLRIGGVAAWETVTSV